MSSHKQPVQIIYCMQALLASSLASLSLHSHTDIGVYDSSRDIVRYSQTVFFVAICLPKVLESCTLWIINC